MNIGNMFPATGRFFKEDGTTENIADLLYNSMGSGNFDRISDTAAHSPTSGVYICLKAINGDATLSSITFDGGTVVSVSGDIIREGDTLTGRFKSVTLSSGVIYAHKGV